LREVGLRRLMSNLSLFPSERCESRAYTHVIANLFDKKNLGLFNAQIRKSRLESVYKEEREPGNYLGRIQYI